MARLHRVLLSPLILTNRSNSTARITVLESATRHRAANTDEYPGTPRAQPASDWKRSTKVKRRRRRLKHHTGNNREPGKHHPRDHLHFLYRRNAGETSNSLKSQAMQTARDAKAQTPSKPRKWDARQGPRLPIPLPTLAFTSGSRWVSSPRVSPILKSHLGLSGKEKVHEVESCRPTSKAE